MATNPLHARIRAAENLWQVVVALLEEWNRRPDSHVPARERVDDPYSDWIQLEEEAGSHFDGRSDTLLTRADADQLCEWASDGDWDEVHAVAWALDRVAHADFVSAWRDEITASGIRKALQAGDVYPVGVLRSSDIPLTARFSTRPDRATDPLPDELPHVRVHQEVDARRLDLIFDFSLDARLEGLFANLREFATLHPNASTDEFDSLGGLLRFPVRPRDAAAQGRRFSELLGRISNGDFAPRMVVAPELSATPESIEAARKWLDERVVEDVLFVPGSTHEVSGAARVNRALAMLPDEEPIWHDKIAPYRRLGATGREEKEAISPNRTLVVYPADRFRFVLLVCKDFLDANIQHVLGRVGVNVVAVPAMSQKTSRFVSAARNLVDLAQAFVVVANGPHRWGRGRADPAAVFAQPVEDGETVELAPSAGVETGFAWFEAGETAAHWISVDLAHL